MNTSVDTNCFRVAYAVTSSGLVLQEFIFWLSFFDSVKLQHKNSHIQFHYKHPFKYLSTENWQ